MTTKRARCIICMSVIMLAAALWAWLWPLAASERSIVIDCPNKAACVTFHAEGKLLAYAEGSAVHLCDSTTGRSESSFAGHKGSVRSIGFCGNLIVSASEDGEVIIWDVETKKKLETITGADLIACEGATIIAAEYGMPRLRALSVVDGRQAVHLSGHPGGIVSIALSPDQSLVASGAFDEAIKLWDLRTGMEKGTMNWEARHLPSIALSLAFDAESKCLVSGHYDGVVRVWDVSTGAQVAAMVGHDDWVNSVAISRDCRYAVSGSYDGTVRVWEMKTGANLVTLNGHSNGVSSVALSRDAKVLASASYDKTVRLWHLPALLTRTEKMKRR